MRTSRFICMTVYYSSILQHKISHATLNPVNVAMIYIALTSATKTTINNKQ